MIFRFCWERVGAEMKGIFVDMIYNYSLLLEARLCTAERNGYPNVSEHLIRTFKNTQRSKSLRLTIKAQDIVTLRAGMNTQPEHTLRHLIDNALQSQFVVQCLSSGECHRLPLIASSFQMSSDDSCIDAEIII